MCLPGFIWVRLHRVMVHQVGSVWAGFGWVGLDRVSLGRVWLGLLGFAVCDGISDMFTGLHGMCPKPCFIYFIH